MIQKQLTDMYILKGDRVSRDEFEYTIYNSVKKERFKESMWPSQAERLRSRFGLVPVSKEQVEQMRLNDWKEVKI